jgi:hypothetical protein
MAVVKFAGICHGGGFVRPFDEKHAPRCQHAFVTVSLAVSYLAVGLAALCAAIPPQRIKYAHNINPLQYQSVFFYTCLPVYRVLRPYLSVNRITRRYTQYK